MAAGLALGMTVELSEICLDRARTVIRQFEATHQLVQRAEDSHRFNVRAGSERAKLDAVRSHLEALERTSARPDDSGLAESRELLGPPLGVLHHRLDRLGPDAALSPGDDGLPAQRCVGQRPHRVIAPRVRNPT
jgi:hypothetical protein